MKKIIIILFLIIITVIIFSRGKTRTMTIGSTQINLLLAKTPQQIEKGLGGFKKLEQNQGMLFLLGEKRVYSFWMKDMLFPLDIIWIDNDKIVDIDKNVQTGDQSNLTVYKPPTPVNFVLEVNSGFSDKYGIKLGDKVVYDIN